MTGPRPPWLAEKLLSGILRGIEREVVLGDLSEEYALRASAAPSAAGRWYWKQAIRSLPVLLGHRVRQRRWMSTLAIALAAYVVVGALNAAGTLILVSWLGGAGSPNYLRSAVAGLIAIGGGAHLASRVRPPAGDVVGGLVAVVAIVMLVFPVDPSPAWYQLTFLILGPVAAHLGSAVAVTRATPTRGRRS